jgi:hypothetical protein
LIVDMVVPENSDPHPSKWLDIEMLLMPGGRERTRSEWEALFAKGGFEITRIVPTKAAESLIEARVRAKKMRKGTQTDRGKQEVYCTVASALFSSPSGRFSIPSLRHFSSHAALEIAPSDNLVTNSNGLSCSSPSSK